MLASRCAIVAAAAAAALSFGAPRALSRAAAAPRASFAEPALSPDHREIAFVSGGDIWTVPATGGEAHLLVAHEAMESRPLYSPDGTRLAFVSTRSGNGDIYVLALATGDVKRVTFDDTRDQLDAWSHDGQWLYFSSAAHDISGMNDEYRVRAEGGTPMAVAGDRYASEFWGAPSPDGKTLAITARGTSSGQWWRKGHSHLDESEISLVRDAGAAPSYTTFAPLGAKNSWPMWSADGGTLYFVSDRGGAQNIYSRAVAGGDAKALTTFSDGRVLWPSIAADGKAITFERDFGIWTLDVTSGMAARVPIALRGAPAAQGVEHLTLATGVQEMALSPDGRKTAFVMRGEIFAASAKDGGEAARVTTSAADEQQLAWSPDSRRLAYTSDRDGSWHLFIYDFGARTETQLTRGPTNDLSPRWSPDGRLLAFTRDARELRVLDVAAKTDRIVATAHFDLPPFLGARGAVFSPDSKWIAYLTRSGARNFQNAYVVGTTGGDSKPITFLGNSSAGSISWSPDGSFILMGGTGQRTETRSLARVDLVPRTPRFREDQFRDLFREETPRTTTPAPAQPTTPAAPTPATPRRDSVSTDSTSVATAIANRRAARRTEIVFDDIRRRLTLLPVGVDVGAQSISPDGKLVLLTAVVAEQVNLYVYPLDELARDEPVARQITSTANGKGSAQWSPDGKEIFYVENGRINSVNVDTRAVRPVAVTAEMDVDFAREKLEVLAQAWSYLRDNFFDEKMNGVDWNAVREQYTPLIEGARTRDEMRRILNLMVGELNASHSGIGGPAAQAQYTGRIGLRFDRAEYESQGRLRVDEVVPLSPAAVAGITTGQYLVSVDGAPIGARTNVDSLLAYKINKRIVLGVAASAGAVARDVPVRPVNGATEKGLLYRAWVEERRAYVAKASGGRLGYVHMFDMGQPSLNQLYLDLDADNQSREGVVIDVRNNNGGFVNVYAIDVLARRPYLTMQSRRQGASPARTALGQRSLELPTVLVTNQHSL
ncbi:MAG: S41 family peptidase, partial [Gemmatimonadaceae bacterium]